MNDVQNQEYNNTAGKFSQALFQTCKKYGKSSLKKRGTQVFALVPRYYFEP
jgi:hypothetical protein